MARPTKEGLGYFPMDVDIDQDDKLIVPIAKHGMTGFGVIVKLMMEIYRNGYFYPWTDKEQYVFPFKIGMEREKVSEIVNDCLESGFFDQEQFERNKILTSYGFQKRFELAANRRKESSINDRFRTQKELMQTEMELLHAETPEMDAESTQSKVKESKVNKTKVNKIKYAEFVFMKESEYQKLIQQYGEENTERMIAVLDNYKGSKGKTYKDDYRAILSWVVEKVVGKEVPKQQDKVVASRNKDVEFQQWVQEGNDPDGFDWS